MSWLYSIDKDRRLVRTTVSGLFRARDVVAFRQHISMDPNFDPTFGMLAIFNKVTRVDLFPEEVRVLAAMSPFLPEARRAFVVAPDQRNFMRLYELFALFDAMIRFSDSGAVRLFTTQKEAMGWLFPNGKAANGSHREAAQLVAQLATHNRSARKLSLSGHS